MLTYFRSRQMEAIVFFLSSLYNADELKRTEDETAAHCSCDLALLVLVMLVSFT